MEGDGKGGKERRKGRGVRGWKRREGEVRLPHSKFLDLPLQQGYFWNSIF